MLAAVNFTVRLGTCVSGPSFGANAKVLGIAFTMSTAVTQGGLGAHFYFACGALVSWVTSARIGAVEAVPMP